MKKSHYFVPLMAVAALLAPAAWAAPAGGTGSTGTSGTDAKAALRQELKDLNGKERAELQAVNTSNGTPEQKKADRQKIRANYRQQRLALRQKYFGNAGPEGGSVRQGNKPPRPLTVKGSKGGK